MRVNKFVIGFLLFGLSILPVWQNCGDILHQSYDNQADKRQNFTSYTDGKNTEGACQYNEKIVMNGSVKYIEDDHYYVIDDCLYGGQIEKIFKRYNEVACKNGEISLTGSQHQELVSYFDNECKQTPRECTTDGKVYYSNSLPIQETVTCETTVFSEGEIPEGSELPNSFTNVYYNQIEHICDAGKLVETGKIQKVDLPNQLKCAEDVIAATIEM